MIVVRDGAAADRAFAEDLGKRTMNDSVAPFRHSHPALTEASYLNLLDYVFAQSHVFLIADDEDRRAGFLLMLDELPDEVTRMPQGFVAYMAVETWARRRGIASRLLESAEGIARQRGLPYMGLMVTESNEAARALYGRAGYLSERRLLCKPL